VASVSVRVLALCHRAHPERLRGRLTTASALIDDLSVASAVQWDPEGLPRARRLLTRYERALARATRAMAQARALLDDAAVLESSLTGTQLGELRRGRPDAAGVGNAPVSTPLNRTFTTTRT